MKVQIDTIPVVEAYETTDECPFCHLQRITEQKAIRYTAGPSASYMEPDVRAATDSQGFCPAHFKKLYDYGNSLGNALMMQTYMIGLRKELDQQLNDFELPDKKPLFGKREYKELPLTRWLREKRESCFLCSKVNYNMRRYYATFFHLIKDESFRKKVEDSKGMCLCHMEKLLESADEHLQNGQREWFYATLSNLQRKHFARVQEDLDWFIEKFDYRNAGADWKNSKDAVSRTMQKLSGIYPADPVFKEN